MTEPIRIDPSAIFDDRALRESLGVSHSSIADARKRGELRSTRKAGKFFYMGRWVQEWLEATEPQAREVVRC